MEGAGVWVTEIILSVYASQLPEASVLFFSHPEFLRAHCGSGYSLMAARLYRYFFLFLECPRAQEFTFGGPELLMTVTSLFTDMAENTPYSQSKGLKRL